MREKGRMERKSHRRVVTEAGSATTSMALSTTRGTTLNKAGQGEKSKSARGLPISTRFLLMRGPEIAQPSLMRRRVSILVGGQIIKQQPGENWGKNGGKGKFANRVSTPGSAGNALRPPTDRFRFRSRPHPKEEVPALVGPNLETSIFTRGGKMVGFCCFSAAGA